MKKISHVIIICSVLFLILGLPAIINAKQIAGIFGAGTDAVSSASISVPKQPSGEYYVFINKENHKETMQDWKAVLNEEDVGVIFEDIVCTVIDADQGGTELANRYVARLAENQMKIKKETALLAASKLQWGNAMFLSFPVNWRKYTV